MSKECVVSLIPGSLYYNVRTFEVLPDGAKKQVGTIKMVHENKLEDCIAIELRGPSFLES
jgi:hypothetical protein